MPTMSEYPELQFKIEKIVVNAKSRRLSAEYTHEFAEDLPMIFSIEPTKKTLLQRLRSYIRGLFMRTKEEKC